MKKQSAGILLYRTTGQSAEVLLVHPGGPFWAKKDNGAWSIPKGEFADGEEPLAAAQREFAEELGKPVPDGGEFVNLGEAKQSSGKIVHAWALQADFDANGVKSNTFEMEWPPKSGQKQEFPEVDSAAWFPIDAAQVKLVKGQLPLLDALARHLDLSLDKSAGGTSQTQLF
jgi:predicted NUDIX family NTP pyrophosphohydrolase